MATQTIGFLLIIWSLPLLEGKKAKYEISQHDYGWLTAMMSELRTYLFTPSLSSSSVIRDKLGSFCEPRMRLKVRASSLTLS